MTTKQNKGFTLLEILLVIAAIGILAAIVLVAINPNRQLAQARNAQRRSDINTIYKALEQYLIDTGSYPSSVNSNFKEICNTGNKTTTDTLNPTTLCDNKADLRVLVPTYLAAMPSDPSGGEYGVYISMENNKISLVAVDSEAGQSIRINSTYPWAEGGDNVYNIVEDGQTYRVHEFKTVGTSSFNVLNGGEVEYLVVAGGGGGGGRHAGGGGAGGFRTGTGLAVTAKTYAVVVGAGGNGATTNTVGGRQGVDGSASSALGISSAGGGGGGGGGGAGAATNFGRSGGSGGASSFTGTGGAGNAPSTNPSQGNTGGNGGGVYVGGGGGGAGAVGGNFSGGTGGSGGAGTASSISGTSVTYAGGGGGGGWIGNTGGAGGAGGGGAGSVSGDKGANGTANTGGGGGGGGLESGANAGGGNGGSGIVIIRYKL
jgi:prepilin-type N-terminal cleavage/methylation domain-containing protein